jgi:hypothetical protein
MYEKAFAQVNRHALRYKKDEPGLSGGRSEVSKIRVPEIPLPTFHGNTKNGFVITTGFKRSLLSTLMWPTPIS